MSSSVQSSRRAAGGAGRLVRSLVLVAVLVPVTILFVRLQDATGEQRSFAEKERHGVTYLASLWQLTLALTDAQAAAVAGRAPADPQALPQAVEATGRVDQQFGGELRSHDRWTALRAVIEPLPQQTFTDPSAAYTAYIQAAEMLLALFGKVRQTSELIRDPKADAYFLEDAVAAQLPAVAIGAGRLADLTLIAPSRPESERANQIATLAVVRSAVTFPAVELAADLRSAVDSTESRTLSGNLLRRLDLFQRTIDRFNTVSAPGANELAPDAGPVGGASTELQRAAADLGEAMYAELDGLIVTRIDDLDSQRRFALAMLALAVLLVVTPIAIVFVPRRRTSLDRRPPAEPPRPAAAPARRPLVTTSARPGTEADGIEQPGWGRSGVPR
jgi:hypothetical protein